MDADVTEESSSNGLGLKCQDDLPEGHVTLACEIHASRQALSYDSQPLLGRLCRCSHIESTAYASLILAEKYRLLCLYMPSNSAL